MNDQLKPLYELIEQALIKSPSFLIKFRYWVLNRKKTPQTYWLLVQLIEIYGIDKVSSVLNAEAPK